MNEYRRMLAFKAGKKAALSGKGAETCNRQRGTIYFDDWHDGYEEGERDKRANTQATGGDHE